MIGDASARAVVGNACEQLARSSHTGMPLIGAQDERKCAALPEARPSLARRTRIVGKRAVAQARRPAQCANTFSVSRRMKAAATGPVAGPS